MRLQWIGLLAVAGWIGAGAAERPPWFDEHLAYMVADGGRWITDNGAYQNEDEPWDAYGTQWQWAPGRTGMTGRLFGLKDGKEVGDFWHFRVFWHPGEGRAIVQQFAGHGVIGIGPLYPVGEDTIRSDQQFFNPDGTSTRVGHDSIESEGRHETRSFDIQPDGSWQPRRTYVWVLEPATAHE